MKLSQVKEFLPFIQALAEGKTVEWQSLTGSWIELQPSSEHFMTSDVGRYRIKPTPTLRPWRPEEVPVGALLRNKQKDDFRALILSVDSVSIKTLGQASTHIYEHSFYDALELREHSLDHGKTWLPCGVLE